MTTPQTQQPQAPQQPQQSNTALVAVVATVLAAQLLPSFGLPALTPLLVPDRNPRGIAALRVALDTTDGPGKYSPPRCLRG